MTQARGINSRVLIDFEQSFGVAPAAPNGIQMPYNSVSISSKQGQIETATITGNRAATEPGIGNITVDGDVVVPVDLNAFGYWLKAAFGAPTTTGASAPYTHKFKPGMTQPTILLEKSFVDINEYWVSSGLKVSSMDIDFTAGEGEAITTFGFMGKNEVNNATTYDATPVIPVLKRLNNSDISIVENGIVVGNITKGKLTVNFGLDGNQYVIGGGGTRGDIPEGQIKVNGNLTVFFDGTALMDKAIASTKTDLKIKFTSADGEYLEFVLPEVKFERQTPGISGSAGIVVDLNFSSFYAANAEKSNIIINLKNSIVSY